MDNVIEMDKKDIFETKDLYLSAYLKAKGLSLIDTRRDGPRVFFVFEGKERAGELLKQFCNGGQVDISRFTKAVHELKTIIYN